MGFNCVAAGYPFVEAMVQSFVEDEENHLWAMVRFIRHNKLDDELRRHDWAGFARGYNGPGFAKNGYDKKLAASFAKWQKIKDTPLPMPAPSAPTPVLRPVPQQIPPVRPDVEPVEPPVFEPPVTNATPAVAVGAALLAAAGAVWQWGADLVDLLTFWN
jgi:hypothetical protein